MNEVKREREREIPPERDEMIVCCVSRSAKMSIQRESRTSDLDHPANEIDASFVDLPREKVSTYEIGVDHNEQMESVTVEMSIDLHRNRYPE